MNLIYHIDMVMNIANKGLYIYMVMNDEMELAIQFLEGHFRIYPPTLSVSQDLYTRQQLVGSIVHSNIYSLHVINGYFFIHVCVTYFMCI